jgi:hypothetical protein
MAESDAGSPPPTRRPAAVRWIVGLLWFRLVVGVLAVAMAIVVIHSFDASWMEGFRRGFIHYFGFAPGAYGARQAGEASADPLLAMLFSALMLWAVNKRWLRTLQVLAIIGLLLSLPGIKGIPIALAVAVLALHRSVTRYCRPASPEPADGGGARHDVIARETVPGGEPEPGL